ncbi:MAG: hypothetical protein Q8N16_04045 [bacterium]|nr:hypothetical protein [bacterium]
MRKKSNGVGVSCQICGKEFFPKPYFLKHNWGRYCSGKCRNESRKTGKYVICAYCGKGVYRTASDLKRKLKTKTYFCNKSCQCAWKNKRRKSKNGVRILKYIWGSWCNSSTKVCGTLREDANSFGPPFYSLVSRILRLNPRKTPSLKRPAKKLLYELYWKKNYTQSEIADIFRVTHTSVKRWLNYYKIFVKPRTLSCGRNPSSLKNLELGKTPEIEKKSAEARRIYTKEKLLLIIREFVEKHGRIPTKNEFSHSRIYPDHMTYRDYFGSWNNAIKKAGYEPNDRWFAAQNIRAKDGHSCRSISEVIIDDWLFENGVSHTREEKYPEGNYRCDFVVENIFIEFFGLINAPNISLHYNEIVRKKIGICKKHRIRLIKLYEKDLYNLDSILREKLNENRKLWNFRSWASNILNAIKLF